MNRDFPQIEDRLEWNLVARESYVVTRPSSNTYVPLPAKNFVLDSYVLLIGVKNSDAKQGWYTGGWASMLAQISPSSTSEFVAAVNVSQRRLRVGTLNFVTFPKFAPKPYILEIKFPEWFERAEIEVWKYDGEDITAIDRLNEILASLAAS